MIDTKIIIEKPDTHEKYYPKLIEAEIEDSYPYSVPTATIKIISNKNLNNVESVSPVRFDDIIRVLVSTRYSTSEKIVWEELFSGRVQNLSRDFRSNNNITLECVGHIYEAEYALLTVARDYTTSTDAKTIISDITSGGKMGRVVYNDATVLASQMIEQYNVVPKQVSCADVFADLEKMSGYKWMIDAKPVYYSDGSLNTCYLIWKPLDSTVTDSYKIIEGTRRLLSAKFDVIGEGVRTFIYVNGKAYTKTNADGTPVTDADGNITQYQYNGWATNSAAVAKFGNRYDFHSYEWARSNLMCQTIALGLLEESKQEAISGQVTLLGTPQAKKGQLIYCKIPSQETNGISIDRNFTVYRVRHSLSRNGFTTSLDLDSIKPDAYDYYKRKIFQPLLKH